MSTLPPSSLPPKLVSHLLGLGFQLSTAESCTGGLIAASCTDVAGSSAWFDRGFVTYSNASKTQMLGVPQSLIESQGAVSEAVARSMALGALYRSQAAVTVAVTGIAGPTGGSTEKPVGTVCFAWVLANDQMISETKHFAGDRQQIRQQACDFSLRKLLDLLRI